MQEGDADEPKPLDLRAVFSDLRFSSANEMGLELVDILTNGVRRALLGNLQPEGWLGEPIYPSTSCP